MASLLNASLVVALAGGATACGNAEKFEALVACSERLEKEFPESSKAVETESGDAETLEELFSFQLDGTFQISQPEKDQSILWSCSGNLNIRQILRITYKNTSASPPPDLNWRF